MENNLCSCNNMPKISQSIPYCTNCINNNLTKEVCNKISNFSVDIYKLNYCMCGNKNAKGCVIQSCKNCCDIEACPLHSVRKNFIYNVCYFCDTKTVNLNWYYIEKKKLLVSYCKDCYDAYKKILNMIIFNNTTDKERKVFKIKVKETISEKKERLLTMTCFNHKDIENMKKKSLTFKIKTIMKDVNNKIIINEILTQYRHLITDDVYKWFYFHNIYYNCQCNELCEIDEIFRCDICNHYKCFNCMSGSSEYCNDNNCEIPEKLCDKSHFKCNDCLNKKLNDFVLKNKDTIITSNTLKDDKLNITEFTTSYCNYIFNCGICNENVNLTANKISKCSNCNDFYCIACGYLYKNNNCLLTFVNGEIKVLSESDDDSDMNDYKYDFLCNNCYKDNKNHNKQYTKPHSFIKLEFDTIANSKDEECVICYTHKKQYACIPCGHLCLCYECKNNTASKCPICNEELDGIYKIFS
jgi:hypothetical protein